MPIAATADPACLDAADVVFVAVPLQTKASDDPRRQTARQQTCKENETATIVLCAKA